MSGVYFGACSGWAPQTINENEEHEGHQVAI